MNEKKTGEVWINYADLLPYLQSLEGMGLAEFDVWVKNREGICNESQSIITIRGVDYIPVDTLSWGLDQTSCETFKKTSKELLGVLKDTAKTTNGFWWRWLGIGLFFYDDFLDRVEVYSPFIRIGLIGGIIYFAIKLLGIIFYSSF